MPDYGWTQEIVKTLITLERKNGNIITVVADDIQAISDNSDGGCEIYLPYHTFLVRPSREDVLRAMGAEKTTRLRRKTQGGDDGDTA